MNRRGFGLRFLPLAALLLGLGGCAERFDPERPPPSGGSQAVVEFLDVGQGDAILIRSPEGKTALVDAGPSRHILDLLADRGVERIDLAVVSHHHSDHYGGMKEVVRRYQPRFFLDADSSHASNQYLGLLEEIESAGSASIHPFPAAPRRIDLGSVALVVLPQPPDDAQEENNNSIAIRVEYGRFSALLTGDSEGRERKWWMAHAADLCAGADVLKLAHHGSRNGVDSAWLNLTHPDLAVASLGAGNDFGHPHRETLALLDGLDIPLRRTDRDGTVTVRSDGKTWGLARPAFPARAPPPPDSSYRGPAPRRSDPYASRGGLVRINRASLDELQDLPGIGDTLARRIMARRPIRGLADLRRVDGLGDKRIEKIAPLIDFD